MLDRLVLRLAGARFLTVSFLIHAVIVIVLGGVVLYKAVPETPDFVSGSEGSLLETPDQTIPAAELSQTQPQDFTPPAPAVAPPPLSMVTTVSQQTPVFVAPAAPNVLVSGEADAVKNAMASIEAHRQAEGSGASGMATTGRVGGMNKISFFGMKTEARRIAFLVDYSGSMEGAFRREMEEELERSLKGLPIGTQILIIPWAGGAWLYNQEAAEIAGKWEKVGGFDNFAVRSGEKLAHPEWVPVNSDNVHKLMKGMQAQKSWPGGTDWRSPFRYVMEATPPPDTIFFMTDGQIGDSKRTFEDIDVALKKSPKAPKVFSLWIANKTFKADLLKALAEKYRGEFRVVDANSKR